jgi:membrane protein DedA with SNARE-associated domain
LEHLATIVINTLSGVPVALVYLIAAVWVGAECLGIGLPVEPVLLFVGSLAAADNHGKVNVALAIIVCAVGCLLFGFISYALGRRYGSKAVERYGRFIGLKPTRADHLELWLRHRGLLGVTALRLTPLLRSLGSFISGVADITVPTFSLGTLLGSAIYCGVWIVIGDLLGANYQTAFGYLDRVGPTGIAIVVAIVVVVIALHWLTGRLAFRRLARHFHVVHGKEHDPAHAGIADI